MIQTIIIIVVVFVLMTLIIFLITKNTIDDIKEKGKLYFALKLQEYEEEKEEEEEKQEIVLEETPKEEDKTEEEKATDKTLVYVEANHNYEVDEIFKIAKTIDSKFSVDSEKIIKEFIKNKVTNINQDYYNNLLKIKEKIDEIGVYNILISDDGYVKKLINSFNAIDKKIVHKYLVISDSIDINDFINYIDSEIYKNDPTIYVLVGEEHINYDSIDSRIKTLYKDNIYKGLKIIYKNKMYDYSLS